MDADGIKCSRMGPETLQAPELCGTPRTRPGSGVSQRSQTPGASGRGAGHCAAQWERWERLSARSTSGWEWVCQRLGTNGRRLQRPAANGAFAGAAPRGGWRGAGASGRCPCPVRCCGRRALGCRWRGRCPWGRQPPRCSCLQRVRRGGGLGSAQPRQLRLSFVTRSTLAASRPSDRGHPLCLLSQFPIKRKAELSILI